MPETLPYGAWRSPITSDLIVGETIGLGDVLVDGGDIYWIEGRPGEGGRNVLVRRTRTAHRDITPAPFNVAHPGPRIRRRRGAGASRARSSSAISPTSGSTGRRPGGAPQPLTPERQTAQLPLCRRA